MTEKLVLPQIYTTKDAFDKIQQHLKPIAKCTSIENGLSCRFSVKRGGTLVVERNNPSSTKKNQLSIGVFKKDSTFLDPNFSIIYPNDAPNVSMYNTKRLPVSNMQIFKYRQTIFLKMSQPICADIRTFRNDWHSMSIYPCDVPKDFRSIY